MAAHLSTGNGGFHKTFEQIKLNYYWESLSFDIHDTISRCIKCQIEKPYKLRTTYRIIKPHFAWHTVSIDVVSSLIPSNTKVKYIIVTIDHLTKWVEDRAINDLSANTTAKFIIKQILYNHGCHQFILNENDTNFTSHVITKLNKLMGIPGVLSTPYHPEINGMVECVNGYLVAILSKLNNYGPSEWSTYVKSAIFDYNIAFHSATGKSLFQLIYGRHTVLPPILYSCVKPTETMSPTAYLNQLTSTLIKLQAEAYSNILANKVKDVGRDA